MKLGSRLRFCEIARRSARLARQAVFRFRPEDYDSVRQAFDIAGIPIKEALQKKQP